MARGRGVAGRTGTVVATLAVGLAVLCSPVAGQSDPTDGSPFVGRWEATWASAVRDDRGTLTVQGTSSALLVLEVDASTEDPGEAGVAGVRLTGRWSTEVLAPINWLVSGTASNGRLRLVATETVSGELPGEGQIRIIREEWTGRILDDGTLAGEQWITIRTPGGERRSGPRPWTARRASDGG